MTYPTEKSGEIILSDQVLVGRLIEVLQLAREHVSHLADYRKYWADSEDPLVTLADKIVVESALLALVASRYGDEKAEVRACAEDLARTLAPQARSYRSEILIRRYPYAAMSLGIAHVALSSVGVPDARFDELIRNALMREEADCAERLPYRAMERRWLSGLFNGDLCLRFEDLLQLSIAARPTHPIYMLATDVYALTHVPMFVTDFGRLPPPPGFPVHRYCDSIDATTAWAIYTDNFDLLGELVLARVLLDAPWTPCQLLAWRILEFAWDQLGFLACPSFAMKEFLGLPQEEKSSYAFKHVYHTTYVAGMLCAALLPRRLAPLEEPSYFLAHAPGLREECASAFRAAMNFCAGDPDGSKLDLENLARVAAGHRVESPLSAVRELVSIWLSRDPHAADTGLRVLDRIQVPEASLASVLADGLLSCAARNYDLPMLSQVLRTVAVSEMPMTSTAAAAARFLIHQQLPDGSIGGWFLAPENEGDARASDVTAGLASCLGALSLRLS